MSLPQHCPTPRELDDLELLVSGAVAPIAGFDEPGSPITLSLPSELASLPEIELVDPEGLPLALARRTEAGSWAVESLSPAHFGPFRHLYLTPGQTHERYAGATYVPLAGPLTDVQREQLTRQAPGRVVLLALVGTGTPALSRVALLRASLRAANLLPDAHVVAVPLARHGGPIDDQALEVLVTTAYAGGDPVLQLLASGTVIPEVVDIVEADQPAPDRRGLVLLFTGLSGSGKSTLARALMDRLLEAGHRTVTSLDGDVVRRHLSAGLTFSAADRETNIRRIGWVAAEISRHGGVAVCSPIAPFDSTRQDVRAMVAEAGGAFFLIHVATPLEECERRDRKGLYAKARRGEIPEFTGISSPYEEPTDADVRVDTTGRTIDDALGDVVEALAAAGYVDLRGSGEGVATSPTNSGPSPAVELVETPAADSTSSTDSDATEPLTLLFVCTANICRSPSMELLARALAGPPEASGLTFTSAGVHGFDASPMDPELARAAGAHGVPADDIEAFRSRPITAAMVREADLVITAEAAHRTYLLDDVPEAFRKVFSLGQLAQAVSRLDPDPDLAPAVAVAALGERRGPSDPGLDVPDPYRQGPGPAEECVTRIEALLRVVLPALSRRERMQS